MGARHRRTVVLSQSDDCTPALCECDSTPTLEQGDDIRHLGHGIESGEISALQAGSEQGAQGR